MPKDTMAHIVGNYFIFVLVQRHCLYAVVHDIFIFFNLFNLYFLKSMECDLEDWNRDLSVFFFVYRPDFHTLVISKILSI